MGAVSFTRAPCGVHLHHALWWLVTPRPELPSTAARRRHHRLPAPAIGAALVGLAATLALGGCSPTTAPAASEPEETYVPAPTPGPDPVTSHAPIEDDVVVVVRATATDAAGARLTLQLQVHEAYAWDYAGIATLPAALVADCGGALDDDQFAAERWSFVRANLTAVDESGGSWVGNVVVAPSGADAYVTGRGMLAADASATQCGDDRVITASGAGAIATGFAGDADARTAWATQQWGFRAEGVTLSECTVEVTDLGRTLGGGTGWVNTADASACLAGPATPTPAR